MFYQSVHLDVDHLNSIYPLSTWKCEAPETVENNLSYAIAKEKTLIYFP